LSLAVLLVGMGCRGQNPKGKATHDLPVAVKSSDLASSEPKLLPVPSEPKPQPGKEYLTNAIGMKLVKIPAGTFTMGSPVSEKERQTKESQHEVEITRSFYMGIYEVTQEEYEKGMKTPNPSFFSAAGNGKANVQGMETKRFPVEQVSWTDAVEFCRKLSELPAEKQAGRVYRLPTEAEWEYACRAGTTTVFHCGDRLSATQANFNGGTPYGGGAKGPFLERTTTVGSYAPNAFGLYDMHGNVSEWCADWYGDYPKDSQKDPQGPQNGQSRVLRGGTWLLYGVHCRAAFRFYFDTGRGVRGVGFRVVLAPRTP